MASLRGMLPSGRRPAVPGPYGPASSSLPFTERLGVRSHEEIRATVDTIVHLLRSNEDGLRAEHIRVVLGMRPREMPRVLRDGMRTKKLLRKGRGRATTYFAVRPAKP